MLQPYCVCCELLVWCLFVEGASIFILGVGALDLDIILSHIGLGVIPGNSLNSVIGAF